MTQAMLTPRDYLAILRRRKWTLVIPAGIVFTLAFIAALVWPPTYRSEATILVEQPDIPSDLVDTVVSDYLERRLEAITRRVLVSDNLLRIIERYDLYPEQRATTPISEVVDAMREMIVIDMISTDVVDPRSGRAAAQTVAFTLSFDYGDPETAQRITNEIVSLYLNENLRQRRERVTETTQFLRGERERADRQIAELQQQMSSFKEQNNGSLPEQLAFNQQAAARAEQELRSLDAQLQSLKERTAYLQAQLALTDPYQLYATGNATLSPTARLEQMRSDLTTMRARYGEEHPDVVRLQREVAALETSLGVGPDRASLERERETAQQALDTLLERYTPDHPDVQRAQRTLANIEASIKRAAASGSATARRPDNPAYIQLQSQLNSAQAELQAVQGQRTEAEKALANYQQLLSRAPMVEQQYTSLANQLQQLTTMRDDLMQRETTAQIGQNLETELKGERFSLIEPPSFPVDPVAPNKKLVLAIGFVLAVGSGAGLMTLRHVLDDAVYSAKDIAGVLGEAPLAVVPQVVTAADRTRSWSLRLVVLLVVAGVVGGILYLVDVYYVPLDVLAINLQQAVTQRFSPLIELFSNTASPEGQ